MNVSGLELSYMGAQTIWANDLGMYLPYRRTKHDVLS
jgi:hypothetical protein